MRRFAQDTLVPVARSRAEIDDLLRSWGCDQLQWSDDYARGRVCLRFDAAALFLPFLEDASGMTVAEMALPRLANLLTGTADRLLPEARP